MIERKVSIITVCYNAEETIEKTIKSVLEQSYSNIEYIIIDGGSTDKTLEKINKYFLCANFYKKYPEKELKYISEKDNGIYNAMNKGIKMATGDLIGIINADDWYEKDAIKRIVEESTSMHGLYIIHGNLACESFLGTFDIIKPNNIAIDIWKEMPVCHPTCFVSKEVYEKVGYFDESLKIAADYEFVMRCVLEKVRFQYINYTIATFSYGGISTTEHLLLEKENLEILMRYIERCPDIKSVYERRLYRFKIAALKEMVPSQLKKILHCKSCVIFGHGVFGTLIGGLCAKSEIKVDYYVDNNMSSNSNIDLICSPEKLKNYRGVVVIAVKNNIKEIVEQIATYGNKWVTIITMKEMMDDNWINIISENEELKKINDILLSLKMENN